MRILHTMVRVLNLEKSLNFYCQVLGMKLLRKNEYPQGKFTLAFVGYGEESDNAVIELTHNWDEKEAYSVGTGFGHIALGVQNINKVCEEIRKRGGNIVREPGPMKGGTTVIAFVKDPDGYLIELIEE